MAVAPIERVEAQGGASPPADEIMKTAHLNLYYPGDDGRTVVEMTLTDKKGSVRTRRFVMLRKDLAEGGAQKYYTYFLEPSDVRRTSFMVWKDPEKDDARWIYVPAVDLVKQISAKDKGSSFVGSDFSYEDVSGRHWSEDAHTLVRTEERDGKSCYVIESVPRGKEGFAKKLTWVGVAEMLPLREEYYDAKGELQRVFTADAIETVGSHLTVMRRTMTNMKNNHRTTVEFSRVDYDMGLGEDLFTERYLKAAPPSVTTIEG
jgi:outer membrane lipoprotein-sorting protein